MTEGGDESFGLLDMTVEGRQEAGDALLVNDISGDGDADFGELVVVKAQAVIGKALRVAVEEADGLRQLEEVAGKERIDAGQRLEHDVGGADESVVWR